MRYMKDHIIIPSILATIFFAGLLPTVNTQNHPTEVCPLRTVELKESFLKHALVVEHTFYADTTSWATMTLENKSSKNIQNLTALVEYFGPSHERLLGVIFQATLKRTDPLPPFPLIPVQADFLQKSVLPEERLRITGLSPITTCPCPLEARISVLKIGFSDGTTFVTTSKEWNSDPALKEVSEGQGIVLRPFIPEGEYLIRINIDRSGKVVNVKNELDSHGFIPETMSDFLSKLVFSPAFEDGISTKSDLLLLVRIHRTGDESKFVHPKSVIAPLVVVDFFPKNSSTFGWRITFGDQELLPNLVVK